MNTHTRIAFVALTLALGGCAETPSEPSPGSSPAALSETHPDLAPLTAITVSFAPGNLLTDTGPMPPTVWIDNGGGAVPQAVLDEVARTVTLRTYPELTPVDATVEIEASPPVPAAAPPSDDKRRPGVVPVLRDHPGRASVVVRPRARLADRWYVLSLPSLPKDATTRTWSGAVEPALGAFATRFHPGSAPVVRDVTLCGKQHGRPARLSVHLSEGILADPATASRVLAAEDATSGEACTWVAPPDPSVPQTTLDFDCPASALRGGAVRWRLDPGLRTPHGEPLGTLDPAARRTADVVRVGAAEQEIDFAAMPEAGTACRIWKAR